MRDIRGDLQERAQLLEEQIGATQSEFDRSHSRTRRKHRQSQRVLRSALISLGASASLYCGNWARPGRNERDRALAGYSPFLLEGNSGNHELGVSAVISISRQSSAGS